MRLGPMQQTVIYLTARRSHEPSLPCLMMRMIPSFHDRR